MPRLRKYEDAAAKQAAYRIRKEKERLALGAAILDLTRAIRQARGHGPVQVALDQIRTDDQARLVREVALAICEGSQAAIARSACSSADGPT